MTVSFLHSNGREIITCNSEHAAPHHIEKNVLLKRDRKTSHVACAKATQGDHKYYRYNVC